MLKKYKQTAAILKVVQLKEIKGGSESNETGFAYSCLTSADCPQPNDCYALNGGYYCYKRKCIFGYC